MKPLILIWGHSFVARLQRECFPTRNFVHGFGLADTGARIDLFGTGGLTLPRAYAQMPAVEKFQPAVVVVDLLSNDLCRSNHQISEIISSYMSLVDYLLARGVHHVYLLPVLPRLRQPYPDYNQRVSDVNVALTLACADKTRVRMWKHKPPLTRSQQPCADWFLVDGVHLNPVGQARYLRSLRGAVLHATRQLSCL